MNSMTGFGRGTASAGRYEITFEIKSVNSRFLDIFIKLPAALTAFEDSVRQAVRNAMQRGKVEITVMMRSVGDSDSVVVVDSALCQQIRQTLVDQGFYKAAADVPVQDVLAVSTDWICTENAPVDEDVLKAGLESAMKDAIEGLLTMRGREGAALAVELRRRADILEDLLHEIDEHKEAAVNAYEERLTQRLTALLEKIQADDLPRERIVQEVAIMADKTDITEEIVRFGTHVVQLRNTLDESTAIGRKLDFLVQEMNREVNTMGSKGSDLSVVDRVVRLKSELEKVREQIQNIE